MFHVEHFNKNTEKQNGDTVADAAASLWMWGVKEKDMGI